MPRVLENRVPTGAVKAWEFPAAPSGWVLLQGGTIGGGSIFSGQARPADGAAGIAETGYGAGGSGGSRSQGAGTAVAGGAGADGIVIVEEYA